MSGLLNVLQKINLESKKNFQSSHAVLSFSDYLAEVESHPELHLRDSAKYLADMIEKFGSYERVVPGKKLKRYSIYDANFIEGEGRVFGQEKVQEAIVTHIKNFVRSGRVDKLLLLHGPNGSAKTSIVQGIVRALEKYSHQDDGLCYQFSWVFPKKEVSSGSLGFLENEQEKHKSFAYLPADLIETRLVCDHRDHPLLLLNIEQRKKLFCDANEKFRKNDMKIPDYLRQGDLSHRNREIFDSLLSTYEGDLARVLNHVRVERFYFSKRYRKAVSVVEPQMSVDASMRQLTSDQSIHALPGALKHLSLYEIFGPLVDGNRGLIEYSDLLKRPLDAWKYLLVACEQGAASVGVMSLFFDLLMIATSNEHHLAGFREYPDWQSFKGRIELIRVPYLLRTKDEQNIYFHQIPKALTGLHIAPHAIYLAARWAVLTRLEPPQVQKYPSDVQELIRDLSPSEKLNLYDNGEAPSRFSQKQARDLKFQIQNILMEYNDQVNYEGRFGASPREVRMMLLNAAQNPNYDHLSVKSVFVEIEKLIEQKNSYEFLRRETVRGYRDANALLKSVKEHYRNILEDEIRSAVGLYSKDSYVDLLTRYILHVSAWTKKEQLIDPLLGRRVDADEKFMGSIEESLLANNESKVDFRKQLITQIGAFKLENPQAEINFQEIFDTHLQRLRENVYQQQKETVNKILRAYLMLLDNERSNLDEKDISRALSLKEGLKKIGYNDSSSKYAVAFLLKVSDPKTKATPETGQTGFIFG